MRNWAPGKPYLVGYSEVQSATPGQTVEARVSTRLETFDADLVRLRQGDDNPVGPGFRETVVDSVPARRLRGRIQATAMGSRILIPHDPLMDLPAFTAVIWFQPTLFKDHQHLISRRDSKGYGYEVVVDEDGTCAFGWTTGNGAGTTLTERPMSLAAWHLVAAGIDWHSGHASITVLSKPTGPIAPFVQQRTVDFGAPPEVPRGGALVIGGEESPQPDTNSEVLRLGTLYGKVAHPALYGTILGADELIRLWEGAAPGAVRADDMVAHWDLGVAPSSSVAIDHGPHGLHGEIHTGPTRLVTGPGFVDVEGDHHVTGSHAAVHLHADDVQESGWEPDLTLDLPRDLKAGVYAIRLSAAEHDIEEHVPLFVGKAGPGSSPIAVLFPTYTYLAYGNEQMNFGRVQLPEAERAIALQPIDEFIAQSPWLGASLYDQHADGSGVCYASRNRPLLTMRPEHQSWLSAGPRHLSADLCLVAWLEHHEYSYDVITDENLHHGGKDLLACYRVVITGSHPEYATSQMLDALHRYLATGGRLMYLGGNGFYWVTSIHPERSDTIEVRRGQSGSRTWESPPGEDRHSSTLEIGGLWRHRGRAPNQLVGVGFAASGWGWNAGSYRVLHPIPERAAFVFDDVPTDTRIGNFGLIMNGCVGEEVDRWDPELGSPSQAMRLATCDDLNDSYLIVVEDMLGTGKNITSSSNPKVRADMVLMPTNEGGAVFSVGSMTWVGSLSHDGYENSVSKITRNVLNRFLDGKPV